MTAKTTWPRTMDPDKTLDEARKALAVLRKADSDPTMVGATYIEVHMRAVGQITNAFESLDAWMSNGGFPPEAWRRSPR